MKETIRRKVAEYLDRMEKLKKVLEGAGQKGDAAKKQPAVAGAKYTRAHAAH